MNTTLIEHARILEDHTSELDYESVLALDDDRFYDISQRAPSWGHTHAAVWLDLRFQTLDETSCERWLLVGEPRLESVQVYIEQRGTWRELRAGSAYPLEQWAVAARQPRFKLEFEAGAETRILVRVVSRSAMLVNPVLKNDDSLVQSIATRQLVDGLVLGMILPILVVAFVVGYLARYYLLLVNCCALVVYCLVILTVNGYLIYLPSLLPWSREIIGLLCIIAVPVGFLFFFLLFRVAAMGRWVILSFIVYTVVMAAVLFVGAFYDPLTTSGWYSFVRYCDYPLVLALSLVAIIRRIRLPWFAWLFSAMVLVQSGRLLWSQMGDHIWKFGSQEFQLIILSGLLSTLISALIFAIVRLHRQEREALAEISVLQHAKNERLEKQVELRTKQLRESLKARSSLLARVTHDLRGPLNRIVNTARQLKTEFLPDNVSKVERIALQQIELIDDLLHFSRTELHQMELILEPGYLYGFLREIEDEGAFLASRQENKLICSVADDLPLLVEADFRQLRRVLINLLNNAAKFTHGGYITLKVDCLERKGQSCAVRFSVKDTGTGFSQAGSDDLLVPFQRGLNAKNAEGFGLGLSIVYELLNQMGANLVVDSQEGKGSSFSFILWLNIASEEEIDFVFVESHLPAADGEGRTLLIVDDVELTRVFMGDLFAGYGFDVRLAPSVEEAMSILASNDIDLVITDQFMPGIDGWVLLEKIREMIPGLPVLLYSASPPRRSDDTGALWFDDTLLKPASSEELLDRVERLCGKAHASVPSG